jgi:putative membrane protein
MIFTIRRVRFRQQGNNRCINLGMKVQILSGIAVFALLGSSAMAQKAQQGSANRLTGADETFMNKAAEGGMAEVELGKLAETRASSDAVKNFGKRMVNDHTKADDQLKSIAAQENVALPTGLSSRDQAALDRLSMLNGADFDRAYMRNMVRDHRTDIAEFQREADHGADPNMKQFASSTLPTLQEHLRLARDAEKQVK